MKKRPFTNSLTSAVFVSILFLLLQCNEDKGSIEWPESNIETKPWTRWWWMGNSLTKDGITEAMEEYKNAGFGGLEITPIYGVKGNENQFIKYLSPEWTDLLTHTLNESKRLGLGIDMATGTGWPFGGPWIDSACACKYFTYKKYQLKAGESLDQPIVYTQQSYLRTVNRLNITTDSLLYPISLTPNLQNLALNQVQFKKQLPLVALMGFSDSGDKIDLTNKINKDNKLHWEAPEGTWAIYAIFMGWHGKMVERAAPGGEGNVIDHFSSDAVKFYLSKFDRAFKNTNITNLRAFFNDSYEVDDAKGEANFTPEFFDEFYTRKGYDLRNHLDIFLSPDSTELKSRLLCDYREVISDLLLVNFTQTWRSWAKSNDAIIRNQAHGSPANILDLYAASDIPETEGKDVLTMKYASSAANITGKQLVSSETATWLNEHFTSTLADIKSTVDNCFIAGVNHIVYHGTAYSPKEEPWPGWMFYAAVHFGPTNTIWKDLPHLNNYITRCQSFLQSGKSANDILLYYPIYDKWSEVGKSMLQHIKSRDDITPARDIAQQLNDFNYQFDYISDKQVNELSFKDNGIFTGHTSYKILIIPAIRYIPDYTLKHLVELASQGATILFQSDIPGSVPGFYEYEKRNNKLYTIKNSLTLKQVDHYKECIIGKGRFIIFNNLYEGLPQMEIMPSILQPLTTNLKAIRRINENGYCLFVINSSDTIFDHNIIIKDGPGIWVRFDPMTGSMGKLDYTELNNNNVSLPIYLEAGESCILQQFDTQDDFPPYSFFDKKANSISINGNWNIHFINGGPEIPPEINTKELGSWTDYETSKYFSGTAKYSITFNKPELSSDYWLLNFGDLHESAAIMLNGKSLDTLICSPYQIILNNNQLNNVNTLEVEVTNLIANRIIFMDQNNINYKRFYNINFPARLAENRDKNNLFTAKYQVPIKSGLVGPVTLTPISKRIENKQK